MTAEGLLAAVGCGGCRAHEILDQANDCGEAPGLPLSAGAHGGCRAHKILDEAN